MTEDLKALPDDVLTVLHDVERRIALEKSGVLRGGRNPKFDEIAAKAAEIFNAPIAQINFLDEREQVSEVSQGIDIDRVPVELTFCAHALTQAEPPLVVLDMEKDERFAQNPYVTGEPHIRFYAGCPVRNRRQKIGSLCVMDYRPHQKVHRDQKRLMLDLAWNVSLLIDPDQTER